MKGIILAGGDGTRLSPLTIALSKQILPVYDKPMIYYPLSVLMLAGIKEILIISTTDHIYLFQKQLGDGTRIGIKIEYEVQDTPRGLADAFLIGEEFIGDDDVSLILGDNIFYGSHLSIILQNAIEKIKQERGAIVFGYYVKDPKPFGVVEFDEKNKVISIEEKPDKPKSNFIVPGIYFYDNKVIKYAKSIKSSERGEIEITTLNNIYLKKSKLSVTKLARGIAWFDAGTSQGLLEAGNFIEAIQKQQGFYIAAIEEIAFRKNYINREQYLGLCGELIKSEYGKYLVDIIDEISSS